MNQSYAHYLATCTCIIDFSYKIRQMRKTRFTNNSPFQCIDIPKANTVSRYSM